MAVTVDETRVHKTALHVDKTVGRVLCKDIVGSAHGHEFPVLDGESLGGGEIIVDRIYKGVVNYQVGLLFFGTAYCHDYQKDW